MPIPPWFTWLIVGAAAMAGFVVAPETPIGNACFALVVGGAVAAVALGIRRHRPAPPGPWKAIAAALALSGLGDLLEEVLTPHTLEPGPSWPDALHLAAYPLLWWAAVRLLRRDGDADDTEAIDGAIVAIAIGAVVWAFFVAPATPAETLPTGARVIAVAYPLADLLLLAIVALVVARGGWALPSGRALGVAVVALLLAEGAFGWLRLRGGNSNDLTPNLLWLASFVAFGIAALHPSMTVLGAAGAPAGGRLTTGRIVLLGAAALAAPLLFTARALGLVAFDALPVAVAFTLVSVLVLARIGVLSVRLERMAGRYQALVERIPVTVYIRPAAQPERVDYVSPRIWRALGYDPAAVAGAPRFLDDRVHPDDAPVLANANRQAEEHGEPFVSEYRIRAADGSWRWFRDEAILVPGEDGSALQWQGVLSDISALKAAELAQRQSEDLFRAAFADAPIGMALIGLDGHFLRVNQALCTILGYAEADLLARTFQEITHPDDLELDVANVGRLLAGDLDKFQMEKRYLGAGDAVVWTQLNVSLVRDQFGAPLYFVSQIQDITDRKAAAADLAAERDLLAALMEQIPDAVFVKDTDLRFVRLNAATARLIGESNHPDAIGKSDADYFPAQHAAGLATTERAVITGTPLLNNLETTTIDGREGWLRSSKVPLRDRDGRVIGLIGVNRDVTDEHRALEDLRAAEERFRNLIEYLPLVVYVDPADDLGTPSYVSPQIESLLGYAPEEWLGNADLWLDCIHPDDRPDVLTELQRSRERGEPFRCEYRARSRDGRTVWLRDHALPVFDQTGKRAYWQGMLIDATDRRLADAALHRHASRLAAVIDAQIEVASATLDPAAIMEIVVARAQALVDADGATIALLDGGDLVTRATSGAAIVYAGQRRSPAGTLAGISIEVGRALVSNDILADPRVDAAAAARSDSRSTVAVPLNHRGQIVGVLQTLATRPGAFTDGDVQALQLIAGLIGGALANAEAFAAMNDARAAAEAASRLKSEFLSTMSHELRTPMNAIIGYAHLLLEGMAGDLTEAQAADVRHIAEGADRLLALIDDVLDLSRIEAGRVELALEQVPVPAVVEPVLASVAPQAAAKGLDLQVDIPADVPPVLADPLRLRQVLLNVVGNAVKFTPSGHVRISARAVGSDVEIAVADTGIGIAPEALTHVFEEFRQADSSTTRRFGGTGLGLTIVRRLLDLHGGAIAVQSTPGAGSTFTIRLPSVVADEGRATVPPGFAG